MRRWKASTSTTKGTVTITEAAMITPHGISNSELPDRIEIATGTVRMAVVEEKVNAKRNSFQAPMNARSPVVLIFTQN